MIPRRLPLFRQSLPRWSRRAIRLIQGAVVVWVIWAGLAAAVRAQAVTKVDRINAATNLVERCQQLYQQERWVEALGFCQQALRIYRQPLLRRVFPQHSAYGEGTTLHNLGEIYRRQGDHQLALRYFEESLEVSRRVGDRYGEAATLWNLGLLYVSQEEFLPALDHLQRAFSLFRDRRALREQETVVSWLQYTLASFKQVAPPLDYQRQCQAMADATALTVDTLCPPEG